MAPISWQRNLYIVVAVEFAVLLAYGFTNPFMPFFIQEMGSFTDSEAAFWSGLATTVFGLGMFFSGPIWGILADRWGRKPLFLRAIFGVAILSVATGLAPNVYWIIGFRATQGFFSGTVAAASAMISSNTPKDRIPFAMGILTVTMFASNTLGPITGGLIAESAGYRNCFFIIAAIYIVGGLTVLFFIKEQFVPVIKGWGPTLGSLGRMAVSREMFPLLIVFCMLMIGPSIMIPVVPLLVKQIKPGGDITIASGAAFSLIGVVATISSLVVSRIVGRGINLKKLMIFSCLGTGLLYLPPMLAHTLVPFIALMALAGTFNGGIMVSSSSLIALSAPDDERGIAYGLQQSANFLGQGIGPILGGDLASIIGLRAVFPTSSILYILAGLLVLRLLPELKKQS